ncbi:hypothetical protein HYX04_03365 [Candidatus Woesearchaeota archaeon]|nr:hypothetical protein [Candidatus Woesearchaeota archaeon]
MARNLGTIVGGLIGGAVGHLASIAYQATLYAAFGPAYYLASVGIGALGGAVVGGNACNYKSK